MSRLLVKYKKPLTEEMSMLTLAAYFGFRIIGKIVVSTFDVNETMGWKISVIHTWMDNIPGVFILIFFGIYFITNTMKIKTDLTLSAIHIALIALSTFLYNFWELDLRIILSFIVVSFVVFGMNIYQSVMHRKNVE